MPHGRSAILRGREALGVVILLGTMWVTDTFNTHLIARGAGDPVKVS